MAGTLDENLYSVPLGKAASTKERMAFAERMPLDIQNKQSKDLQTRSERGMMEQHQRQPRESPAPAPPQEKQQQQQEQVQQRQRQHHHRQQKVFVADDKFTDVIAALLKRGWTRSTHANSPNFDLKWRNLSNINFRLLRNDQFINHVFNSQQLSNKALLTGHLGFQHEHLRRLRQPQQLFRAPAAPICGANSTLFPSPSSSSLKGEGCSNNNPRNASDLTPSATAAFEDALDTANPESFFPRCWDVSDDGDGLCSMLRAFAVSAAVALLRTAVQAQDVDRAGRSQGGDYTGGAAAALAAATSVTSRYISSLQSSRNIVSSKPPPTSTSSTVPDHSPAQSRAKMRVGLSCCGRDAADAAITVGDPDFMAILEAWEAATTAAATGAEERAGVDVRDKDHAAEAPPSLDAQKVDHIGEEESGSAVEEEEEEDEGRATTKKGSDVSSQEDQNEKRGTMTSALERAMKVLRTLDEDADPQAALCLGPANAWVVKPAGSSCGRGVEVASTLRGLVSACRRLEWKAVVQKYVERPLLVQGYKFDIRQWVLVTSCHPLVVWGFDESYVRFSSRPFAMDASSLSDRLVHLCNHSVQKEQASGVDNACNAGPGGTEGGDHVQTTGSQALPSGSQENMWQADQLRRHLRQRFEGKDVFQDVVLPRIRSVVVQTLLAVREGLERKGRALEWLGFDLMVTEDLRVMLIEVNVSPDVSHSTPVTARLVPDATNHALSLLLDDDGNDARATTTPLRETSPSHPSSCKPATSMLADEHPGVTPASLSGPDTTAEAAGPNSLASHSCVRGRQEGKPGVVEKLRWRLWHKGEEESRTVLRSLREGKKAWLEARREKRRQRHGRRRASDSDGALSVENDREMALAVIEGIVSCPLRGNSGTSDRSRGDRLSRREAGLLPTLSYPAPTSPRVVSPSLPSMISASGRIVQDGSSMEGCSSGHGGAIRLRESVAGQPIAARGRVNAGRDLRTSNVGGPREEEEAKQEEEEDEL